MQTVLYVSRMTTGDEVQVREIQSEFPVEVLDQGIGVERMVAFIGSGMYALEITVADGDFQEQFHRFLGTTEVRALFDRLSPYVESLPSPDQQTADMPLMAAAMLWQTSADQSATR
jgi:hypothetical protein